MCDCYAFWFGLKILCQFFIQREPNQIKWHTLALFSRALSMLREIAGNSDYFITLFDPVVIDWPEQIILTFRRSFENCFIRKGDFVWLPVISLPGSFATNQLAIKIFILSISTEVDNKRATINAHIFFLG